MGIRWIMSCGTLPKKSTAQDQLQEKTKNALTSDHMIDLSVNPLLPRRSSTAGITFSAGRSPPWNGQLRSDSAESLETWGVFPSIPGVSSVFKTQRCCCSRGLPTTAGLSHELGTSPKEYPSTRTSLGRAQGTCPIDLVGNEDLVPSVQVVGDKNRDLRSWGPTLAGETSQAQLSSQSVVSTGFHSATGSFDPTSGTSSLLRLMSCTFSADIQAQSMESGDIKGCGNIARVDTPCPALPLPFCPLDETRKSPSLSAFENTPP